MRRLFTVILDYAGGTYASQVHADDAQEALRRWAKGSAGDRAVWNLTDTELAALVDQEPIALDGLTNVWCASISASQGLALANLVETVRS